MRILFLTQFFQPEPMLKALPFAQALRDEGHEVEVLTGFPNYPGGKVYPGYRIRPYTREVVDGITVHRLALYPSHDASGVRRMLNYGSFGLMAALVGPWVVQKPDVVYVYNLITLGLASRLLRFFRGARIVLDIQDLWPEGVLYTDMLPRFLGSMLTRWADYEYRKPDHIVTLSEGFRRRLMERGLPGDRVQVIPNWCDEHPAYPGDETATESETAGLQAMEGRFNVVFAGTMGKAQSLDAVVEAARLLGQEAPEVLFTFVGGGVEVPHLRELAAPLGNVQFIQRLPPSRIGTVLARADALLVHLRTLPLFDITIPSKVQAYMHAGRPILLAVPGDAADMVVRAGAGVTCRQEDPRSLADAVLRMHAMPREARERMGLDGRAFYERECSRQVGVEKFIQLFQTLTQGPPPEGA